MPSDTEKNCKEVNVPNSLAPLKQEPIGSVQTRECKDGYALFGEEKVTGQTDGTWSSLPQCRKCGECYQLDYLTDNQFKISPP